jgi:Animal haem peroxidase
MISRRKFFQTATLGSIGLTFRSRDVARSENVTARAVLASAGTKGLAPGGYTRMFPNLKPAPSASPQDVEKGLRELGEAMIEENRPQPGMEENRPSAPPAGYTYLGQFIDHDLTLDLTPLSHAGDNTDNVEQIQNFRTPYLDLDQLYGGGPNLSPFLYHADPDPAKRGKERFLIGKTTGGRAEDLPRNPEGIALAGDPRQDENLILAQLHVAFLKLHNLIISSRKKMDASTYYKREGDSDFAIAQRVVRWHYQWIVRHDYLKTIVCDSIAKKLEDMENVKRAAPPLNFKIPVEFSMAAFRFGHSMVRNRYDSINHAQKDVTLETLLSLTGAQGLTPPRGQPNTVLPDEWRVCWNRFFEIPPLTAWINRAETIDTKIAGTLHHLDEPHLKQFSARVVGEAVEPSLPVRSLLRGFRAGLPSGEQVAAEVARRIPGIRVLKEREIIDGPHKDILKNPKYGFRNNTPLWYYILKEAELEKLEVKDGKFEYGFSLGPVGSYIVADTIIGALVADRESYVWSAGYPGWQPTLEGVSAGQSKSMANLLALVSSTDDTEDGCDQP